MNEEYQDKYGNTWVTDDALVCGRYLNTAAVGAANVRWFEEKKNQYNTAELYLSNIEIDGINNKIEFGLAENEVCSKDFIIVSGNHSHARIFVNKNEDELAETVYALEKYPCIDDQLLSQIEAEWHQECWNEYILDDLMRECQKQGFDIDDYFERNNIEIDDVKDTLFNIYNKTLEQCDEYPVCEDYESVYVDVEKIAKAFYDNVSKELTGNPTESMR